MVTRGRTITAMVSRGYLTSSTTLCLPVSSLALLCLLNYHQPNLSIDTNIQQKMKLANKIEDLVLVLEHIELVDEPTLLDKHELSDRRILLDDLADALICACGALFWIWVAHSIYG